MQEKKRKKPLNPDLTTFTEITQNGSQTNIKGKTTKLLEDNKEQNLNYLRFCSFDKTPKTLGVVAHTCNPSTLGGQVGWIMRSRDRDHTGQHGETPSLLKIQKLSGRGGARRLRQENRLNLGVGGCTAL